MFFVEASATIILPPKDQYVNEPDVSVEFTMKLSKSKTVPKWYKDGRIIVPKRDKYEIIEDDKETYRLIVHHVESKDAGNYTVGVSDDEKATAKLIVQSKKMTCLVKLLSSKYYLFSSTTH